MKLVLALSSFFSAELGYSNFEGVKKIGAEVWSVNCAKLAIPEPVVVLTFNYRSHLLISYWSGDRKLAWFLTKTWVGSFGCESVAPTTFC